MLNKTLEVLDLEIRKFLPVKFREKSISLSGILRDDPKLPDPWFDTTSLANLPRRKTDLIVLALLSWYCSEEIGFLLRLQIEEEWRDKDSEEVKDVVLNSKEYCLAYLILQDRWGDRDFFGNILTKKRLERIWYRLSFKKVSHKRVKKYTGWCRGHPEGHHRRKSFPLELSSEEVFQIEEQERLRKLEKDQRLLRLIRRIEEFLAS